MGPRPAPASPPLLEALTITPTKALAAGRSRLKRPPSAAKQLAINVFFICSGFGTRMVWYSFNVAIPYFTYHYGPDHYAQMLLGYNLGALGALFAQVRYDAFFDDHFGLLATYTFRINLGLGCLLAALVAFPFTPNQSWISIVLVSAVGVFDYTSSGALTQMASRCGGLVPNFFFLGQACSGVFLFLFTEFDKNNSMISGDHHEHLMLFFFYAAGFVLVGWVTSNLLLRSKTVRRLIVPRPSPTPAAIVDCTRSLQAETALDSFSGVGRRGDIGQMRPLITPGTATVAALHGSQSARTGLVLRKIMPVIIAIIVLWVGMLTVQALFGMEGKLQQPLMFVNMFALMGGMQLNVALQDCLRRVLSMRGVLLLTCTIPPAVATFSVLHALRLIEVEDSLFMVIQGAFYVSGGLLWMLCYTLALPRLSGEEKVEGIRLLNLATQVGILIGIGIGMAVMHVVGEAAKHKDEAGGSGSGGLL